MAPVSPDRICGRASDARPVTYGAAVPVESRSAEERDAEMREALRRQAIEVLAHQLEVERQARAKVQGREVMVAVVLFGGALGAGYAALRASSRPSVRRGGGRRG